MDEVSKSTFDILERLSRELPGLNGGFARGTGGVDADTVVAVLYNEIRRRKKVEIGLVAALKIAREVCEVGSADPAVEYQIMDAAIAAASPTQQDRREA